MFNHQRAMRAFKYEHRYLALFVSTFVFIFGIALAGAIGLCPIVLAAFIHWSGILGFILTIPLAITIGAFTIDLINY
jgi:hypothetical protein